MASTSASPITQVDEPQAVSLANAFAPSHEVPQTDLESPNSPNPGAKPARPPKALKRPSTANARGDNGSESTTVVSDGNGEVSKLVGEDVPTLTSSTSGDASGLPVLGAPVVSNGVDETKRSSTVSDTTGNSSTKTAALPTTPSPSDTAKSSPATTTAPPPSAPAKVASTPTPAASTSKTPAPVAAAATRAPKPASTKRKKGGFLSFLGCCGGSSVDDTPSNTSTAATKRPVVSEKVATAPVVNNNVKPAEKEVTEKQPLPAVDPVAAITPPPQDALVAASPDTPAGPPPPTAAPSARGVVLPPDETEGVTSGAVVPPGQSGTPVLPAKTKRKKSGRAPQSESIITSVPEPGQRAGGGIFAANAGESSEEETSDEDEEEEDEEEDEEQGLIARGGVGIPIGPDGQPRPLLDVLSGPMHGRKCLVLDLDETLVHSSFKMVHQADYVVPVEIENQFHNVYVIKRPGVDEFLRAMGEIYEVVVFTASLSKYADPVLDQLDIHRVVQYRLFRESCYNNKGNYVKDLSQLGRPMEDSIIIDNSPASYVFHPNNAVPISSWFNDPHDTELTDLIPFLTDLATTDDVRAVLDANLYQSLSSTPATTVEAGSGFVQA